MKPYYQDDLVTLYHGDCKKIIPHIPPVDLILTDPPYGITWNGRKDQEPGVEQYRNIPEEENFESLAAVMAMMKHTKNAAIFGLQKTPSLIPYRGAWVLWDKRGQRERGSTWGSPIEQIWVSKSLKADKIYEIRHSMRLNANGGERVHPKERPIELSERIIKDIFPEVEVVFDPFAGSGTTLLAAKMLGKKAIGIEIEECYCNVTASRLSRE